MNSVSNRSLMCVVQWLSREHISMMSCDDISTDFFSSQEGIEVLSQDLQWKEHLGMKLWLDHQNT